MNEVIKGKKVCNRLFVNNNRGVIKFRVLVSGDI